jgi:CBS domain-containing protein
MKDMRIRAVMKTPVITVLENEPFSRVEEKFRQKGIRHLPVVNQDGRLTGLITQRDLFRISPPRWTEDGYIYDRQTLDGIILRHVMKKDPLVLGPGEFFSKAVILMAENKFGCIPIVDENKKVVGILSETDVLKFAAKYLFEEKS